jgi:hypothetical protein
MFLSEIFDEKICRDMSVFLLAFSSDKHDDCDDGAVYEQAGV